MDMTVIVPYRLCRQRVHSVDMPCVDPSSVHPTLPTADDLQRICSPDSRGIFSILRRLRGAQAVIREHGIGCELRPVQAAFAAGFSVYHVVELSVRCDGVSALLEGWEIPAQVLAASDASRPPTSDILFWNHPTPNQFFALRGEHVDTNLAPGLRDGGDLLLQTDNASCMESALVALADFHPHPRFAVICAGVLPPECDPVFPSEYRGLSSATDSYFVWLRKLPTTAIDAATV